MFLLCENPVTTDLVSVERQHIYRTIGSSSVTNVRLPFWFKKPFENRITQNNVQEVFQLYNVVSENEATEKV